MVILPVPYDGTSTWVKGADRGPEALIEAPENMELYDIETDSEVHLIGIHTSAPVTENASPEEMSTAVRKRVDELLRLGKFVVTVGGEHSVSIGAVQYESPVCTPMASTFSIKQTVIIWFFESLTTSSSSSSQPKTDSSIRTCPTKLAEIPLLTTI